MEVEPLTRGLRPILWTGPMNGSGVSTMRMWAAGVVAVVLLIAGCGGVTDGAPAAAPVTTPTVTTLATAASQAWDPCTIPDEAIEAAGLAVETKRKNAIGETPVSELWSTCYWMNPIPEQWYLIGIFSSTSTLDDLQERGPFEQFTSIDGFDGLRFQRTVKYEEVSCGIAFGREGGVIYLMLDGFVSAEPLADPCVEVERVARSLRPSLPTSK